jgi:hypothetical protein
VNATEAIIGIVAFIVIASLCALVDDLLGIIIGIAGILLALAVVAFLGYWGITLIVQGFNEDNGVSIVGGFILSFFSLGGIMGLGSLWNLWK